MGRSLRISEEMLERVKAAFKLKGWTQDHLAGRADCTRQTVNKFFARGYIEKRVFEALCSELNLIVADIADSEPEEGLVNTSVSVNGNREQSLGTLTQEQTETDEPRVPFAASGTIPKSKVSQVKAILALLQEVTGDTSIAIVDIEKGSIRLILEGSQASLEQIEALFKSGQLTEVEGIPVENVQFVAPQIPDNEEDIQVIDKKRLAFTIAGSVSSTEIQELKAAFSETSDNDEEIDNKARLIQEIIINGAKGLNLSIAVLNGANLSGTNLSNADLRGTNLRGANLSSANLSLAVLSGANLSGADLSSAKLSLADLSSANLSGANLSGANLRRANLSGANLRRANLSGANLSEANLSDADLIDANLSDADLSRANLIDANLSDADLSDAILSDAILSDARIDAQTKIDSKWRLVWEIVNQGARERDLIGIDLSDANLSSANLIDANLSSANLIDANLSGANLSGANLSGANLSGANLRRANLSGVYLSGAYLSGAYLSSANLIDANLSSANLSSANLIDANLSSANLIDANLIDANLVDANLVDANLSGANLRRANLIDANLIDAVVENARFGDNLGLSEEMKRDLKRRGAIFEDSPGDRSGVLSPR